MAAFVDESIRHAEPRMYVLVACIVPKERHDESRDAMRGLLLRNQRRLHWRDESVLRREAFLARISSLQIRAHMVRSPLEDPSKQERARALCLRRILWILGRDGILDIVIEGRQRQNDQRDRRTILRAQKAGEITAEITYRFARPQEEPLLWIADALAGASIDRSGRSEPYLRTVWASRSQVP